MTTFWQNFITYITSATIVAVALGWVLRRLIDNFFSHKIEQYKAQLDKENIKYRITYERLHAERAEVIKNVYKKIVNTYDAFHDYIKPLRLAGEPTQAEHHKIAGETFNNFSYYYRENRIFFAEPIACRIDAILNLFMEIYNQFEMSKILKEDVSTYAGVQEWNKAFERLKNEVPPIKSEIEKEFRNMIGIE